MNGSNNNAHMNYWKRFKRVIVFLLVITIVLSDRSVTSLFAESMSENTINVQNGQTANEQDTDVSGSSNDTVDGSNDQQTTDSGDQTAASDTDTQQDQQTASDNSSAGDTAQPSDNQVSDNHPSADQTSDDTISEDKDPNEIIELKAQTEHYNVTVSGKRSAFGKAQSISARELTRQETIALLSSDAISDDSISDDVVIPAAFDVKLLDSDGN